jgi:hypothetical protein
VRLARILVHQIDASHGIHILSTTSTPSHGLASVFPVDKASFEFGAYNSQSGLFNLHTFVLWF